jgi:hypothetical protein
MVLTLQLKDANWMNGLNKMIQQFAVSKKLTSLQIAHGLEEKIWKNDISNQ